MAFDIYGQPLARGHCEVHPDVPHEYPCPCCMEDYDQHRSEEAEAEAYYAGAYEEYIEEMLRATALTVTTRESAELAVDLLREALRLASVDRVAAGYALAASLDCFRAAALRRAHATRLLRPLSRV